MITVCTIYKQCNLLVTTWVSLLAIPSIETGYSTELIGINDLAQLEQKGQKEKQISLSGTNSVARKGDRKKNCLSREGFIIRFLSLSREVLLTICIATLYVLANAHTCNCLFFHAQINIKLLS